jgi:hypothetical protein
MNQQNYHCSIIINSTPKIAMEKIDQVSSWWASNFEGSSAKLNDMFTVHFGDTFVTFKVIEMETDKKRKWKVVDCNLHWLKDKKEWNGTTIDWEVKHVNNSTRINFTHVGLVPQIECYKDCVKGWNFYVGESLLQLIKDGVGKPETPKVAR